jgi:hypothetical protein
MSNWTRDSRSQEGPSVITSRFLPSRILGAVAATVCCPAFTCFVSTSRCLFVSAYWETAVFEVSPTNDLDMRLRVRLGYPSKMKRKGSQLLHDMVCWELNKLGEASHKPLTDCMSLIIADLREKGVISWIKMS